MGSDERHFNLSLIVRDKVTRQCPQTTGAGMTHFCIYNPFGVTEAGKQKRGSGLPIGPRLRPARPFLFSAWVLLYGHRNRRLIRDGSPGRPPRLSVTKLLTSAALLTSKTEVESLWPFVDNVSLWLSPSLFKMALITGHLNAGVNDCGDSVAIGI